MKGLNVSPSNWQKTGGSAQEVLQLGYSFIRIHLTMNEGYQYQLAVVPDIIADCAAYNVGVIFNIRNDGMDFVAVEAEWAKIIDEYDQRSIVTGYDLMNEPEGFTDYVHGMVKRLRKLTDKTFIIEAGEGSGSSGFEILKPINDDNIIYSAHMYWPGKFCLQGIKGRAVGFEYPDIYWGKMRSREDIVEYDMRPLIDFQQKYNVPVLIGELGCSLQASDLSADRWFTDSIGICNEYGWDYVVHSYPVNEMRLPL